MTTAAPPKKEKVKQTFMLHDPVSLASIGRFVTTAKGDWRAAALKAASRGHTKIYLRRTGTKEVREYSGAKVEIPPKTITRGDRSITYTHRPSATFVRSFVWNDGNKQV